MRAYTACARIKVHASLVDAPIVSAFDSAALSAADIASSCYWYNICHNTLVAKSA
jgi:hypothetical protein